MYGKTKGDKIKTTVVICQINRNSDIVVGGRAC